MPLIVAPINKSIRIVKILTDEKTKKHLESLGVLAGEEIVVLASSGGSVICKIKDGRMAFDRNLATKILVA